MHCNELLMHVTTHGLVVLTESVRSLPLQM